MACALPQHGPKLCGPIYGIRLKPGSRLQKLYGCDEIVEHYFCSYELNPAYEPQLASAGLDFVARASGGEVRGLEMPGHRFFVATLFQPQLSSTPEKPHPLLTTFVQEAAQFAGRSTASHTIPA